MVQEIVRSRGWQTRGWTLAFNWQQIKTFWETLTEEEDTLTREMVSRISDKWSLWTMSVIAEAGQPIRVSRIMSQVDGISQKSLTKTLRGLHVRSSRTPASRGTGPDQVRRQWVRP